jgi:hypothetical protein
VNQEKIDGKTVFSGHYTCTTKGALDNNFYFSDDMLPNQPKNVGPNASYDDKYPIVWLFYTVSVEEELSDTQLVQDWIKKYSNKGCNVTTEPTLADQIEEEAVSREGMSTIDDIGKVDCEMRSKSIEENETIGVPPPKRVDYIGKDDREITCRSTTVNKGWSISLTEDGSKCDSNEMTISQDSEYARTTL